MSDQPLVDQFHDDIISVISQYCETHALTVAETVGTLSIIVAQIIKDHEGDE